MARKCFLSYSRQKNILPYYILTALLASVLENLVKKVEITALVFWTVR